MKKSLLNNAVVAFLLTILIASCTTSQDVASNNWIQKRKYTKGYHIEKGSKSKMDVVKAEETFTAQEVAPVQTEAEITSAPAAIVSNEVAVAENKTAISKVETTSTEKKSWKEKGVAGKLMSKGAEKKAESKSAFADYKADKAAVGAVSPLGTDDTNEMDKNLKRAILAAIIATVCYIIAAVMYASRVANYTGVGSVGWGAAAIFYILGYVFYIIAVVYFIIWLISIFS